MNKAKNNVPSLSIKMNREELANAGVYVDLDVNTLHLSIDTKYDQTFVNFLDAIPAHLTEDETWRLTEAIDASYTAIMVQRCFNKAAKLSRTTT